MAEDKRSIFRQLVKLCPPIFSKYLEENPEARPQLPCSLSEATTPDSLVVPSAQPTTPDSFIAPSAQPITQVQVPVIPGALIFENTQVVENCPVGSVGDNINIAAGEFREYFHFQSIPGIPQDRLTYISSLSEEDLAEFLDPNIEISRIKELTKVDQPVAEEIKSRLTDTIEVVQYAADAAALARLVCVYENEQQQVSCIDPDAAATDPAIGSVNPAIVEAGTFTASTLLEANALAVSFGENIRVCLFLNEAQTAACDDELDPLFPTQSGFADPIPTDQEFVEAASELRVGTFTVQVGAVVGDIDQDDVNEQAATIARTSLACFYLNVETTRNCGNLTPPKLGTIQNPVNDATAPGNPVTVRAGLFSGVVSQQAVDNLAETLALNSLECLWSSAEVEVTCPTVTLREGMPDEVEVEPSEARSPVFTFTAPVGFYISDTSQQDANDTAEALAQDQLDCVYCNPEIAPVCVPDSAYTPGVTALPLSQIEPWWSRDATRGTPAGAFCDSDALTAVLLAEVANAPLATNITDGDQCIYESDEVSAACVADPALDLLGKFEGANQTERDALRQSLSRNSVPDPQADDPAMRIITWAKGRVTVAEGDIPESYESGMDPELRGKSYVNYLAQLGIVQELNCFFENGERRYFCDGDILRGIYEPEPVSPVEQEVRAKVFVFRSALLGMEDFNGYYREGDNSIWSNGRRWFKKVGDNTRFYNTEVDATSNANIVLVSSDISAEDIGASENVAQFSTPEDTVGTATARISSITVANSSGNSGWASYAGTYFNDPDSLTPVYQKGTNRFIRLNNSGYFELSNTAAFSSVLFSTQGSPYGALIFKSVSLFPANTSLGSCTLNGLSFDFVTAEDYPVYTDLTGLWQPTNISNTFTNGRRWCVIGQSTYTCATGGYFNTSQGNGSTIIQFTVPSGYSNQGQSITCYTAAVLPTYTCATGGYFNTNQGAGSTSTTFTIGSGYSNSGQNITCYTAATLSVTWISWMYTNTQGNPSNFVNPGPCLQGGAVARITGTSGIFSISGGLADAEYEITIGIANNGNVPSSFVSTWWTGTRGVTGSSWSYLVDNLSISYSGGASAIPAALRYTQVGGGASGWIVRMISLPPVCAPSVHVNWEIVCIQEGTYTETTADPLTVRLRGNAVVTGGVIGVSYNVYAGAYNSHELDFDQQPGIQAWSGTITRSAGASTNGPVFDVTVQIPRSTNPPGPSYWTLHPNGSSDWTLITYSSAYYIFERVAENLEYLVPTVCEPLLTYTCANANLFDESQGTGSNSTLVTVPSGFSNQGQNITCYTAARAYTCEDANLNTTDKGNGSTTVTVPPTFSNSGQNITCYYDAPPLSQWVCETDISYSSTDQGHGSTGVTVPGGYSNSGDYLTCYYKYPQGS